MVHVQFLALFFAFFLRPLFVVPRSRSQMFLTVVSPPKDQDTDVRFPNSVMVKTSLDTEANGNV